MSLKKKVVRVQPGEHCGCGSHDLVDCEGNVLLSENTYGKLWSGIWRLNARLERDERTRLHVV